MCVIGRSSAISRVDLAVLEGEVAPRRGLLGSDRALPGAMVKQREGVDDEGVLGAQAVRRDARRAGVWGGHDRKPGLKWSWRQLTKAGEHGAQSR